MFHVKHYGQTLDTKDFDKCAIGDEDMEMIFEIIKDYQGLIMFVLIILVVILIFIEILNRIELSRVEKRYKKLMKGSHSKSIEEMVMENTHKVEESLERAKNIESVYKDVDNRVKKSIQKYSIVRFRAFEDVGSDLSYSIALLNQNNDGVVITGIYGRNESTTFAKPIENGISKYDLTDEEKTAIKNAISGI
jgi:hypothetical protein